MRELELSRSRRDYLYRLGIQKDEKVSSFASAFEALEQVERVRSDPEVEQGGNENECDEGGQDAGSKEMNALDLKSQHDFRVNFLRKLSYSKVWVPQARRAPKYQTVIIFDWDDTLLCTSFLNQFGDSESLPPVVKRHVREIQSRGRRLLELAMRLGHTFIITNASHGWVEYSAAKWVPDLLPLLEKVPVISARSKYEPQFPGEVNKWKIEAFLEVRRLLDSQIITNLLSLGDSNFEMEAVQEMGKEFARALVKTIKFRENPSPEEVHKQLELVGQKFEYIVQSARNLKIGLERTTVGSHKQT